MRKGYLLNEMLVVIAVMAITMGICTKLLRSVTSDIPKMSKDFQTGLSVNYMLERLQSDIENAAALPQKVAEFESDENTLLIESDDGLLIYSLQKETIVKSRMNSGNAQPEIVNTWNTRNAKVSWKVWQDNGNNAVEVTTYIERTTNGKLRKKLKNSHVYFVGLEQKLMGI